MNEYVLVATGLLALVVGAEALVRGGATIATRLGVSPLLVGLTVVSIGTSLPELAVGIDATLGDAGAMAIGNIAGTNIVNILLILGMSAAMTPLALHRRTLRVDLPCMVVSALALLVLSANGTLSRLDGTLLLVLAVTYTALVIRADLTSKASPPEEQEPPPGPWPIAAVQLAGGIAVVVLGADWLVDGAVRLATDLGVSEAVIGLTVLAIGTSAPELVTTLVSTLRGNRELAIGNLIGSSVYNITFILGTTALVGPMAVDDGLIRIDIPLMAAVALLCIPVFVSGRRISRFEGAAFVGAYAVYLGLLLVLRT
ncbi:calcium/sodium antiporter [Gordonia amarae]|uniref:Calcium/sodium antiporter n=2 Tax=Gordonia amarae TaxID=36821 RepID=A0A857LSX3_9ACTN|nr:calcium/sodium antiporter [Gordonia amarae]MCS3881047.1 cation:H+ antiporter [Gordonia amarae]QHN19274.1 calcium/sodium antiporter [Gordonia amarae]QHN23750.1 calcium/sodium antiporter [Gordonia amarae]QHN32662.1 calcium/sodium antiporter [Gordonia amarae]QHN41410.1 calcium/sodium antiporter [Gordonia amarae]